MDKLIPIKRLAKQVFPAFLLIICFALPSFAQCDNWKPVATLVSASNCAASGSFSVLLTGPDAVNLTNIQYGIPLTNNGFSVPLNNSSTFTNIPPNLYPVNEYTVSVVANCGGHIVGKNTTIRMQGSYAAPYVTYAGTRASPDCPRTLGNLSIGVGAGRRPYSIQLLNVPSSYSGPLTFSLGNSSQYTIGNLPSGSYRFQIRDTCGSGTIPQTAIVNYLPFSDFSINNYFLNKLSCDSVLIGPSTITTNDWAGYLSDTSLKWSMFINGITPSPTTYQSFAQGGVSLKLPAGKTIKDCYGQTITFTVRFSCNNQIRTFTQVITTPYTSSTTTQTCSPSFNGSMNIIGPVCTPLTYTLTNTITNASYGPFTTNNTGFSVPNLPVGSYACAVTTADGYVINGSINATGMPASPYRVDVISGASGLQNYIEGFLFTPDITPRNASIELFSAPPGYSYSSGWSNTNSLFISQNQTPILPNSNFFIPGNYIWKITDECGVYYLPVTVGSQHLFQFTASVGRTRQFCEGLWIWPVVTAQQQGVPVPAAFSIIRYGQFINAVGQPVINYQFNAGDSALLTVPGTYTIAPSATYYTANLGGYPNAYTVTYSLDYNRLPVTVDVNHTQGFLCAGASAGNGQIYTAGLGGVPFSGAAYHYSLAAAGNGLSGPYLQANTTGIFTGSGIAPNVLYDVKVEDSCGAFAIQQVRILDLATSRLISSTRYVACENDPIQLSAVYLPGATYVWTGPNGFTSTLRNPVLPAANLVSVGVYKVTITTPSCSLPVTDSTVVAMNGAPPRPTISKSCDTLRGIYLTINNPSSTLYYEWDIADGLDSNSYHYEQPADEIIPFYKVLAYGPAYWRGIAIDSNTGCKSYSDTIYVANYIYGRFLPRITSPHLKVCNGDTTILIAQPDLYSANYQWYRNGIAIPGATAGVYLTSIPGSYKVFIDGGFCFAKTSPEVVVDSIPTPAAAIAANVRVGCEGDTLLLTANAGAGYAYTWTRNGTSIPNAATTLLRATQTGIYRVTVANSGCARTSDTLGITINPRPVIALTPATDQLLCGNDTVRFTTPANSSYSYRWYRDGLPIAGATGNEFKTATDGIYTLSVTTETCPQVSAGPVKVTRLSGGIFLGNDTTVCQPGPFAINLSVASDYDGMVWSDGSAGTSITVTKPGLYWVLATNRCGTFTDTVRIHALSEYEPNLPAAPVICNDANLQVFTVPSLLKNVNWSTGETTQSIVIRTPGTYWVSGESPCGLLQDTMVVTFCPPQITSIILPADTICEGDCIALSAAINNYPQYYKWTVPGALPDTSTIAAPRRVCYSQAGVYPISLWVSNPGGQDSFTRNIVVATRPVPRFDDTTVVVSYKKSVLLPACADAAVVNWYKDDSLVCANCKSIAIEGRQYRSVYHCIVSNGGCADSCIYKLQVIDIPHDVWLPDAFTPNGDGRNDVFRIITDNPNVYGIGLELYNRWGQKVYAGHSREDGWDGRLNGRDSDAGTYFWVLKYKVLGTEETFSKKGELILIR